MSDTEVVHRTRDDAERRGDEGPQEARDFRHGDSESPRIGRRGLLFHQQNDRPGQAQLSLGIWVLCQTNTL
ncbi:hypothetical protein DVH24_029135 [Malus domestica]|uniref:Uncharacterized protein n=1 Tax=Malus domestica TaxID=3750 RepID=A0A498HW89_MALDO|nr:hypothetical protein DVH24_029135 [Malus domestica]